MSCEIYIDTNHAEYTIGVSGGTCDNIDITVNVEATDVPIETDPYFTASAAYGITTGDIAEWNGATGQMATHLIAHNHALLHAAYSDAETPSTIGTMLGTQSAATPASGDVFPFVQTVGNTLKKITLANLITQLQAVESDPIFTASPARAIVTGDIMNWNAAYGWGDHEGLYDATGGISGHLTAFNHALIHAPGSDDQDLSGYSTTGHTHTGFETSGNMSQHLTDYDHAAFITSADLSNDYEASGAVAAHLIAFNHNLTGLYETSGGLASHLTAFNHGLIQIYETSGEMSGHLTDYDHADFVVNADLLDYSTTGHTHSGVYEPVLTVDPDQQATDTRMLAGFVDRNSTISIAATGGEFTLTLTKHASCDIAFYCNGVRFAKTSSENYSVTGLTTSGTYWIYYDANGNLAKSASTWSILNGLAPVSIVYYQHGTGTAVAFDERHGCGRNLEWHNWAHDTIGARLEGATSFQLTTASLPTSFSIATGIFYDEDVEIRHSGPITTVRHWYRNGGLTFMDYDTPSTTIHKQNTDATPKILYDLNGVLTPHSGSTTRYYVYWLYASNGVATSSGSNTPIYSIMGQARYASSAAAQAATPPSILGTITAELKLLYLVVFQQGNGAIGYTTAIDKRFDSTVAGTSVTAIPSAAGVTFVPYGDISSSNVQAAIQELDDEKANNTRLLDYSTTGHNHDSTYLAITSKAASGEINTGTDDAKFITSKGLSESYYTYSAEITIIKKLTAAEYAALTPKSDTTLYIIVG